MIVRELTDFFESRYRSDAAESWDNVGLLVGDDTKEISHVYLALDLTSEVLEDAKAVGADMIVTHHPLIFSGLKKINNRDFTGRRVLELIRSGIHYYAMHTNYDILGMADLSARKLSLHKAVPIEITFTDENGKRDGLGRVGYLPRTMTLRECASSVKEVFELPDVRFYGEPSKVLRRAAVCTGSGKSLINEVLQAKADVYITGDIDHHTGIDCVEKGLCVIDAGHYGTEYIFMAAMKEQLAEAFPDLKVSSAKVRFPYRTI